MIFSVRIWLVSLLIVGTCASVVHGEFLVYAGELPPYHAVGEDKQVHGVSIDILEELMRRSNIGFDSKTVRHAPWARAIQETELKPGRMLVGVARTEQREKLFKWIGPFCTLKMGLIAKKSRHIRMREVKDISAFTIGVINKSAPASVLQSDFGVPESRIVALSDGDQQFKMLEAGRVDLITHVDSVAPYFMTQLGYNPQDYEMVYVLKVLPLYYAVNVATDDALVMRMQRSFEAMNVRSASGESVCEQLLRKYKLEMRLDVVSP